MEPFLPPPLPPALRYDADLVSVLGEARGRIGELAGLGSQLSNPHLLIRPLIRVEAVHSSRIEGTEADEADLVALQAGQRSLPGLQRPLAADVQEVKRYVDALDYALGRLETLPVSLRLLCETHHRLLRGGRGKHRARGEFRKIQNFIGPPGCTLDDATYVPPPAQEIDRLLGDLERYIHEPDRRDDPLVRLAFIHYQFEAIHPFLDGNGRLGRLLISLLLVSWELLPLPLLYLSVYFERRRSDYYELLEAVTKEGRWRDWVLFFLQGVSIQAEQAAESIRRLQERYAEWKAKLSQPGTSVLVLDLLDKLFERPLVTIPDAAHHLGISYPSAKRHVERLVDAGVLVPWPDSYPKSFVVLELVKPLDPASLLDILTT